MNRAKVLLSTVPLLLMVCASPSGRADDSRVRMVSVTYISGTVRLNNQSVTINTPIIEGNVLSTSTESLAEVRFEDGSTMRLGPETEVTFSQLARLSSGNAITRVDLDQGEAEFFVEKPSAGFLAVDVHNKNILFKHSGRYRILSINSDPLELAVWKGMAEVHDHESGQNVEVEGKETFTLAANDPQQYDLQEGVAADELDRWSQSRDNYLSANSPSNGNGFISPSSGFVGYGFGDICQTNFYWGSPYFFYSGQPYWFAAAPGLCFNSLFFYPPNFYGFVYPPVIYPPFRRPPRIHPPTPPPLAAGVLKLGSGTKSVQSKAVGTRPAIRVFDEDNFKRTQPVEEAKQVQAKDSEATAKASAEKAVEVKGGKADRAAVKQSEHTSHSATAHSAESRHSSYSGVSGSASSHPSSFSGSGSRGFSGGSSGFSGGASSHSSSGSSGGGRGK